MPMKNPHVIWAGAISVVAIVIGAVTLSLFDKDPTIVQNTVLTAAIPLLAVFGFHVTQKLGKVEDNTNGTNRELLSRIEDKDREIARLNEQIAGLALKILPPPEHKD